MDPVTRIEGHMKVEITIDKVGGADQVVNARCTGTLFRGFETILQGREPWDAPVITPRICGVCPVSHAMASVLAIDGASRQTPPANGRVLRNLVLGANYVQSHILHFYLLAALDYAKGPRTAPWVPAWDSTLLEDLSVTKNLPKAIEARRRAHEMGAVFGGKMPIPHSYLPGGFTSVPSAGKVSAFRAHLSWLQDFIQNVYIPDVELLTEVYSDYTSVGRGCGNLLAYGVFDLNDSGTSKLFKRGWVAANDPNRVRAVQLGSIKESVTYSWYKETTNNLAPSVGDTQPLYPKNSPAYSWLKAPRYNSQPFEVGPLARMWVNGDYRKGVSVMDRHLARAYETLKVARAMDGWLDQLVSGGTVYKSYSVPDTATGVGLTEAPRGALGHWLKVSNRRITGYQIITPTCWNASPRDSAQVPGPMEQALVGTPIANADEPIEALRVIHSFDPCLSCAVHIMRPSGKPIVIHAGAKQG
jgi:hydrogenase large subunit